MNEFLVITAIGADRPGIVDELSRILLDKNLNIEDSRMSVLGGEFAIILLVSGNTQTIKQVQQEQPALEQALQLNLLIKPTAGRVNTENTLAYEIKVNGMDHPGIVNRLARFLSQHSINIDDLETESYPAAHTGTPMFAVEMTVDIPTHLATDKLKDDFMALCEELNLDVQFAPIDR
ncbi:MAG: glycine cleavage system protein R [Gammaproteobacteria bacterium]